MIGHEYLYLCVKYDSCQIIRNIFYSFKTYCVFHQCTCWDQRGLGPKRRSCTQRCVYILSEPARHLAAPSHLDQNTANVSRNGYNVMHLEDVITHLIITCVISSGRRNYLANCLMASGYHERLIQLGRHASSNGKLTEMQVYDYFV